MAQDLEEARSAFEKLRKENALLKAAQSQGQDDRLKIAAEKKRLQGMAPALDEERAAYQHRRHIHGLMKAAKTSLSAEELRELEESDEARVSPSHGSHEGDV